MPYVEYHTDIYYVDNIMMIASESSKTLEALVRFMPERRPTTNTHMSEISKSSTVSGLLRYSLQDRYVADLVPLVHKKQEQEQMCLLKALEST